MWSASTLPEVTLTQHYLNRFLCVCPSSATNNVVTLFSSPQLPALLVPEAADLSYLSHGRSPGIKQQSDSSPSPGPAPCSSSPCQRTCSPTCQRWQYNPCLFLFRETCPDTLIVIIWYFIKCTYFISTYLDGVVRNYALYFLCSGSRHVTWISSRHLPLLGSLPCSAPSSCCCSSCSSWCHWCSTGQHRGYTSSW